MKNLDPVCRLCPNTHGLINIFDKRIVFKHDMVEVVLAGTGVEITEKDEISQKVCSRCCNITLKMFNFRQSALKHDKELREKLKRLQKEPSFKPGEEKRPLKDTTSIKSPKENTRRVSVETTPIHPSVAKLYQTYPKLKLPRLCLSENIAPFIYLEKKVIEEYFEKRKNSESAFDSSPRIVPKIKIKALKAPKLTHNLVIKKLQDDSTSSSYSVHQKPSEKSDTNKRKSEESLIKEDTKKIKLDKPHFIHSLGLTPKPTHANESPLSFDKESTLHICNICNSVQYSMKDLKRHQNNHLVCQFCRKRFRTLEKKNIHLESSCIIKNAMNSDPVVEIEKIEYNSDARRKFRRAFAELPNLPQLEEVDEDDIFEGEIQPLECEGSIQRSNLMLESAGREVSEAVLKPISKSIPQPIPSRQPPDLEVIEILSDEDDLPNQVPEPNIAENLARGSPTIDSGVDVNSPPRNPSGLTINNSAVRPQIRVKGNDFLGSIDPKTTDVKVIHQLLGLMKPPTNLVESSASTDFPKNKSIRVNRTDSTAELTGLKSQLLVYKVPLIIKNGQFNVCYSANVCEKKVTTKHVWSDLDVIGKNQLPPIFGGVVPRLRSPPKQAPSTQTIPNLSSTTSALPSVPRPQNQTDIAPTAPHPTPNQIPVAVATQPRPSVSVALSKSGPTLVNNRAQSASTSTTFPGQAINLNSYAASLIRNGPNQDAPRNIRVKNVWELQ